MNTVAVPTGRWDKVEFYTSYFLLTVLVTVIGMRLSFDGVWQMPQVDLVLSTIALLLVVGSFWFGRHNRRLRLWVIAFASATQLVPMVIRQPVLLFPLIGALIPVAILVGCLVALSKKNHSAGPSAGS
ncbi:LrgA [Rhodanobacter sp. AS-Z3]|uniref:LrgA n=1 Tax=Rhodanobacter sp. AS-Z3 TaxID=3031330 RepID=UPI00247B2D30|nr:LrgA [Rhodanobacter sp. AS-Z3]WEN13909.1 LrgA [Rhodanobacter sp. AS-Z3]